MSILSVNNVSVNFVKYTAGNSVNALKSLLGIKQKRSQFKALSDFSHTFKKGDKVGVLGKNGAGKTTLLKVIAGILPPSLGSVETDLDVLPIISPTSTVILAATCLQNLQLRGYSYGLKHAAHAEYVEQAIDSANLGEFINSPVNRLSMGMRNRLFLSMLKVSSAEVLLMDEWIGTSDNNMFEKTTGQLTKIVNESDIFILASHREQVLRQQCNKGLVLDEGKLVFVDNIEDAIQFYNQTK